MTGLNTRNTNGNEEWLTEDSLKDPDILPELPGYCILVRPTQVSEKSKGGIILAPSYVKDTQYLNTVGKVIKLGKEAYTDENGKPKDNPWCKEGDHVLYHRFAGAKFLWGGVKYLILNDDEIIASTDNPEYIDPNFNLSTD
jgi:chaperonin GroES